MVGEPELPTVSSHPGQGLRGLRGLILYTPVVSAQIQAPQALGEPTDLSRLPWEMHSQGLQGMSW